MKIVVIVG